MGDKKRKTLSVVNWDKYQHYKKRSPSWIKLHGSILDDYDFLSLPDATKGHLILLWAFASRVDNVIPDDPMFLAKRIGSDKESIEESLNLLIDKGFIASTLLARRKRSASTSLAPCKHHAIPETETETETETEERRSKRSTAARRSVLSKDQQERFDRWYEVYPLKVSKDAARKAFKAANPDNQETDRWIDALRWQIAYRERNEGMGFVPNWANPATWINSGKYDDRPDDLAVPVQRMGGERREPSRGLKAIQVLEEMKNGNGLVQAGNSQWVADAQNFEFAKLPKR